MPTPTVGSVRVEVGCERAEIEIGKADNFGRMVVVGVGRADKDMREVGMRAGRGRSKLGAWWARANKASSWDLVPLLPPSQTYLPYLSYLSHPSPKDIYLSRGKRHSFR